LLYGSCGFLVLSASSLARSICNLPMDAYSSGMARLTREELIRLVHHIMTTSGCVVDVDALLGKLESNVPHPNVSELIFNPPSGKAMTAEQIVDEALKQ
jgi:hypothetical protein